MLSVVINTINEEKNLPKAIASVKDLADEIVVVDMQSTDHTRSIAKDLGAVVFEFESRGYVEPARNFAIEKAKGDWILILDADEQLGGALKDEIKSVISRSDVDYFRVPRKNIIFGMWIKHTLWWPDYQIRLFKKGKVSWSEVIHSVPETIGMGQDLEAHESLAIIHNNYLTVDDYLARMNRYTTIQAKYVVASGFKFDWSHLITKPWREFVGRFFIGQGYKDGAHGLALSLLQAFSELVVYIKVWQTQKFVASSPSVNEIVGLMRKKEREMFYYQADMMVKKTGSLLERIRRKFRLF